MRTDTNFTNPATAGSLTVPFTITNLLTGLAVGTQIWIDAVCAQQGGAATSVSTVTIAAVELP